ncbi:hypothetical protein BY996DRAFT_7463886 [Phakopsora pachyrhizi]|nr:hypothetical protein BY996DRAFT_7463886 [Phakopsora pachyrhizi]
MATSSDDQSSSGRAAEERDGYSRFTELDLLLLRLERSLGNGDDYEDVRLLNELIGPANAHRLNVSDLSSNCNNSYSNDSRSGECREKVLRRLIEEEDEGSERMVDREGLNLRIGTVEEIYRRIDKDGRVKKKMSLLGVRCNKCIICLSQFKSQQRSILLNCSHVFHKKCILNWFIRDEENQRLAGIRTIQQPRTTSAGSGTSRGSEGFYCCPVCKKVEVLFK